MKIDLNELEALARAATPGPWEATRQTDDECSFMGYFIEAGDKTISDDGTAPGHADALFIAAANPAAVLELIALARQATGVGIAAIPLVSGEELLTRTQPLPKWIDNMKGSGPTTDSLIEYIEQLPGDLPFPQPAQVAAAVVKGFDIEDAQVLFSAAENMRSADKYGPVVDARYRIAYKVEQIAKRMFAQPSVATQPVQQPAPVAKAATPPQTGMQSLEWDAVNSAANTANNNFGQWMPERWLQEFVKAYNASIPAHPVQPDADLVKRLTHERDALGQAIADAALKAGMYNGEVSLTGPHLIMFAQHLGDAASVQPFQQRVQPWMMACFGAEISADKAERNHRFFEESTELVQAGGMTASEARQLVDYVYGRPVGEPAQEVGGVMVTLAALCLANGLDMHQAAEVELARIWTKVESIRAKQAAKPKHSPLPAPANAGAPIEAALAAFCDQEGYPSDGPMDGVLRKAFAAGASFAFDWEGGA